MAAAPRCTAVGRARSPRYLARPFLPSSQACRISVASNLLRLPTVKKHQHVAVDARLTKSAKAIASPAQAQVKQPCYQSKFLPAPPRGQLCIGANTLHLFASTSAKISDLSFSSRYIILRRRLSSSSAFIGGIMEVSVPPNLARHFQKCDQPHGRSQGPSDPPQHVSRQP